MKKLLNILVIFLLIVVFISPSYAYEPVGTLHGNDVIERIDSTTPYALDLINKFTSWSSTYKEELKTLIDSDVLDDTDIDTIINNLNNNEAKTALQSIRDDIIADKEYINTTFDMIEYYLDNTIEEDNIDDVDIYYEIRNVIRDIKTPLNNLVRMYFDLYYNEAISDININDNNSDLIDLYSKQFSIFDKQVTTKLKEHLNKLVDFYVTRDLYIYKIAIKNEFVGFYQDYKNDQTNLFNMLKNKLKTKIDEEVDNLILNTNLSENDQVINTNGKIYDIMDKLGDTKTNVKSKFDEYNLFFKDVDLAIDYSGEYEDIVIPSLDEVYNYTKSKLIDMELELSLKNNSDSNKININDATGIILYNSTELNSNSFIGKFNTNFGSIRTSNIFNSNIGTTSKVEIYYKSIVLNEFVVAVLGDVNADGKIGIIDYIRVKKDIMDTEKLNDIYLLAADMNQNNKIDIIDYIRIKKIIMEES